MEVSRSIRSRLLNERGFTLPEVLTVIAIMGILLAIGIIILLGILEQRRVDAATNQLVADLRLAHTSATNQLTDWRVVVTVPGSTPPSGGCSADYCLVKLAAPYVGGGAVPPAVMETAPRDLPDGTKILMPVTPPDPPATTIPADPANTGTFLPSVASSTRTVEVNSDGTTRALGSPSGTLVVSSTDEDPRREVVFNNATSRVRIKP